MGPLFVPVMNQIFVLDSSIAPSAARSSPCLQRARRPPAKYLKMHRLTHYFRLAFDVLKITYRTWASLGCEMKIMDEL